MSDERKKTGVWPWIVALLIGLPVLYVASLGPACWITSRASAGARLLPIIYAPIVSAYWRADDESAFVRAFVWYSTIGAADGWGWFVVLMDSDPELVWCSRASYFGVPGVPPSVK